MQANPGGIYRINSIVSHFSDGLLCANFMFDGRTPFWGMDTNRGISRSICGATHPLASDDSIGE